MKKIILLMLFTIILLIGCKTKPIFTIEFFDYDGTLITSFSVEEGDEITAPGNPSREGYNFTGWDQDFKIASKNLIITAQYEIKTYVVQFYDNNGNELLKNTINHGGNASAPTPPSIEGKEFKGWDKEYSNITQDLKIYPLYDNKTYTVRFVDHDGTVLKTETVEHGKAASAPEDPTREGYDFSGWDKKYTLVNSTLTVNAQYEVKTFLVTFTDYDNSLLKSEYVNFNENATPPLEPTRDGYTFKDWDKSYNNIKGEMNIKALYDLITYTISFDNISKATQTTWNSKEEFLNEFYTDFFHWIDINIEKIPGLTKTNDVFTMTKSEKTAIWSNITEMRALDVYDVERTIGTLIYKPFTRKDNNPVIPVIDNNYFLNTEPYRSKYVDLDCYFLNVIIKSYSTYDKGYNHTSNGRVQIFFRFHQWNKGTSIAAFDTLPMKMVPLIDHTKVVLPNNFTYNSEQILPIPNPTSESLTFLGWFDNRLGAGLPITEINVGSFGNKTLYARWDVDPSTHEITFLDQDFTVLKEITINNGESVSAPTITPKEGYKFIGWDKDMNNITNDITFTAKYEKIKYTITFDGNSNIEGVVIPASLTYTVEDNLTLPLAKLDGYFFLGWYNNPEGSGNEIKVTNKGNVTLYAKWLKLPVQDGTITLVANDTTLYTGSSTNLYTKKDDKYLLPQNVKFVSSDTTIATVDENGFVLTKKTGIVTFLAVAEGSQATIEITVTDTKPNIRWVGHQGSGGPVVQNTVSAFEEGGKRGYYAMEIDVRVSADGVYYICHDDVFKEYLFVDSSLHDKLMGGYTWEQLKTYQVKDTYNGETYYGYLATVEEFLTICKKYNAKAVLELKWTNGINSNDQSKLPGLVDLVKKAGMYENAIFMTSMINCLVYLRSNYKDITLQYLTGSSTTTLNNAKVCIANRFSLDATHNLLTKEIIDNMHEAGLYVNAYTVNNQVDANRLISIGVDMITTDNLGQ